MSTPGVKCGNVRIDFRESRGFDGGGDGDSIAFRSSHFSHHAMIPSFQANATAFDTGNALYLALASELAYAMPHLTADVTTVLGISPSNTIAVTLGDIAGYVAADDEKIIVAFRGSEAPDTADGIHDWLTDFEADTVPLGNYINLGSTQFGARIHQGFADGAKGVFASIVHGILTLDNGRNLPLWITGHSLGGALAVATTIFFRFDALLRRPVRGLYTFGQPRVANPILANALDQDFAKQAAIGSHYIRMVNNLDVVPRVPIRGIPPIYGDAGQFYWFDDAGRLNPNTGPNGGDLFKDAFADLLAGLAPTNPFGGIFAALGGDLTQPVTDHCLRDNPFTNQFNPQDYLPKLAAVAGVTLPPPPA